MSGLLRIGGRQVQLQSLGNGHINPLDKIAEANLALDYRHGIFYARF